jgi:Condensation domain
MSANLNPQAKLPVTVGQRMLWFLHHYQGRHGAMNCPVMLALHGPLDVARLERAWHTVVCRHEALQTGFTGQGAQLMRHIFKPTLQPLPVQTFAGPEPACSVNDPRLQTALRAELRQPIALNESCHRARLWRLNHQLHVLCINQHHLVTDAVSCGIISHELGQAYDGHELAPVAHQFSNHVQAEHDWLATAQAKRSQAYWCQVLTGAKPSPLPGASTATHREASGEDDTISFHQAPLGTATMAALERQAHANHCSVFVWLLALFKWHLHRITGQSDLSVGTLLANRGQACSANTVGFLANMVVLRSHLDVHQALPHWASSLRDTAAQAVAHQRWPYQLLPAGLAPTAVAREVVFQLFTQATHQTRLADLDVQAIDPPNGLARRFDLDLVVMPHVAGYRVLMAVSNLRFSSRWATGFLKSFIHLILQNTPP